LHNRFGQHIIKRSNIYPLIAWITRKFLHLDMCCGSLGEIT